MWRLEEKKRCDGEDGERMGDGERIGEASSANVVMFIGREGLVEIQN